MLSKKNKWVLDCRDYWVDKVDETNLGVDFTKMDESSGQKMYCWRCGNMRRLQKCHIVPKTLGGSCDISNIVPLCGRCHDEAPDVIDPKEMWRWLGETSGTFNDVSYYLWRVISEKIRVEEFTPISNHMGLFMKVFDENSDLVMYHCPQSLAKTGPFLKDSTVEWLVRKSIKDTIKLANQNSLL